MSSTISATPRLSQVVADKIRCDIASMHGIVLPSCRAMAAQYHVSIPTVLAALQILAHANDVILAPGRRPRLPQQEQALTAADTSAERMCRIFYESIAKGELRTGETLPKVRYLAKRYGVSDRTISSACNQLTAKGILHRSGRGFMVGPAPMPKVAITVHASGAILIISPKTSYWEQLYAKAWNGRFAQAVVEQSERTGIRLIPHGVGQSTDLPGILSGLAQKVDSLGGAYLGAICVAPRLAAIPWHSEVIGQLLARQRPVVWFDYANEGAAVAPNTHGLIRCHYSESLVHKVAVDYLCGKGFRSAAFVGIGDVDWQTRRAEELARIGAQREPKLTCIFHRYPGADFFENLLPEFSNDITWLAHHGPPHVKAGLACFTSPETSLAQIDRAIAAIEPFIAHYRAHLKGSTKSPNPLWKIAGPVGSTQALLPLVQSSVPMTLIAPNDQTARWYHLNWLKDHGLVPGRDVPIISFDNLHRAAYVPLTSIDPGFGDLGYRAFHAILKDIPLHGVIAGSMPVQPFVVERDSVRMAHEYGETVLFNWKRS